MPDSRIVSMQEIESKIAKLQTRIADNRAILETLSIVSYPSKTLTTHPDASEELIWIRSVVENRANLLKETLDRLHEIRHLYKQNRQAEAVQRQQKLAGMLFIDGVVIAKVNPDASIF